VVGVTTLGACLLAGANLTRNIYWQAVLIELGGGVFLFAALALIEPRLTRAIRQAVAAGRQRSVEEARGIVRQALNPPKAKRLSETVRDLGEDICELGFVQGAEDAPGSLTFRAPPPHRVRWVIMWERDSVQQHLTVGSTDEVKGPIRIRADGDGNLDGPTALKIYRDRDAIIQRLASYFDGSRT
jgi:hypothetical protein